MAPLHQDGGSGRLAAGCWITAGLLLAALAAAAADASGPESARSAPDLSREIRLPLAEVETYAAAWLQSAGYAVRTRFLPAGAREIEARAGARGGLLLLSPNSALSTVVEARFWDATGGGGREAERLSAALTDHLARLEQSGADSEALPESVFRQRGAVVCINALAGRRSAQSTGVAVARDGLVLSTTHGSSGATAILVELMDGRRLPARIVRVDPRRDLALLQVAAELEPIVSVAEGRRLLGPDERLYAVGCPAGRHAAVAPGAVELPPRRAQGMFYWQVRMDVEPGGSGSPAFDAEGRLAGLLKGRLRGRHTTGFIIPLDTLMEFLDRP